MTSPSTFPARYYKPSLNTREIPALQDASYLLHLIFLSLLQPVGVMAAVWGGRRGRREREEVHDEGNL